MRVLITGFEPFGGEKINPAYEAVKGLDNIIDNAEIIKLELPTAFLKAGNMLEEAIKEHNPEIVICVGQAGRTTSINLEKVGINLSNSETADNEGKKPDDEAVKEDGETAYFSTLPIKSIINKLRDAKIPAQISYSAGTYVCNETLYRLLYLNDKEKLGIVGGFIHVPYLPEQVVNKGLASMSLEMITAALEIIVAEAIEFKRKEI